MTDTQHLVLENGTVLTGKSFGAKGDVLGEIVFTTGLTGYLETLTDPSYYGQIVVQTFPLIGNYGIIPSDFESKNIGPKAYIVKHPCAHPSNFRSEGNLHTFLEQRNIVGLCGIDTRALTKIIRENGVMNGMITSDPSRVDGSVLKAYQIKDAISNVSVKEPKLYESSTKKFTVTLLDFGYKENILRSLLNLGCDVWVLPHDTRPDVVLSYAPNGIMLSNGPGDPKDNTQTIEHLKVLTKTNIPIFGICLGHQLLALAHGFETHKLKYGHRGANQPVKDLFTNRVYITSQNHGYAVTNQSIDENIAHLWFQNVNDATCEGIRYLNSPVCSVQFHPEACAGPLDTAFLFEMFIEKMEERYAAR